MFRLLLITVWGVAVISGMVSLYLYQTTPGEGAIPAPGLALPAGSARLMLFGHPRCPCTITSLQRLNDLRRSSQDDLSIEIVLVRPRVADDRWMNSASVRLARQIPQAELIWDDGGTITASFGVRTSGHVMAFDRQGNLCFSGGITPYRGHDGESPAAMKIRDLMDGHASGACLVTPVFGCPVFGGNLCEVRATSRD